MELRKAVSSLAKNLSKQHGLMMAIKVAVLIPTYNGVKNIRQAMQTLSKQPFEKFDISSILLYDDASTDDTVQTALNVWSNVVPLKIRVADANQGLFANHNAGIQMLLSE